MSPHKNTSESPGPLTQVLRRIQNETNSIVLTAYVIKALVDNGYSFQNLIGMPHAVSRYDEHELVGIGFAIG